MQQHVNVKLCWSLSSSFVCHNVAARCKAWDRSVSSECLSVEVCMNLMSAQIVVGAHSEVTATDLTELPPTCSAFSEWSYKVN